VPNMKSRIRHPPRKRGPVPPTGGRVRITVNLPCELDGFLREIEGRSMSDKFVTAIRLLKDKGNG